MKVLTFFNEKGGVGKTTLTALFASWLAYKERQKVHVVDCDYPSYQLWGMQQLDVKALRENLGAGRIGLSLAQMCKGNDFYKVSRFEGSGPYGEAELRKIASHVKSVTRGREGYLIMDFPGRFLQNDAIHRLVAERLIDLVVFPVDSDRQSRSAAVATFLQMRRLNPDQRCAALWNRETGAERKAREDRYADASRSLESMGMHVISTRVRDILIARRDSTSQGFIRNTLCWPQQNIDRACPWIEDTFREVRSLVDET